MITFADRMYGEALNMLGSDPVDPGLQTTLDHLHDLADASHRKDSPTMTPKPLKVGDRVRTTVPLETDVRICGHDPAVCKDIPAGSLGTVTGLPSYDWSSYGVLLDDDVHRLPVGLDATDFERTD